VALVLQLRLDWRTLPEDWLEADNAVTPTSKHVDLFIPLRDAALAGSDRDGVPEFHSEPLNPRSVQYRIYPRCVTLAGLKIPNIPTLATPTRVGLTFSSNFRPRIGNWTIKLKP